jgi:hypothetical protein
MFFSKKTLYLQCLPFETGEMARHFMLRAFFMPCGLLYRISSVPCGVLMHPQPVSGGKQRGAELFLFPLRNLIIYCFILMLTKNEKSNRSACKSGKRKPYLVMAEP